MTGMWQWSRTDDVPQGVIRERVDRGRRGEREEGDWELKEENSDIPDMQSGSVIAPGCAC